MNYTIQYWNNIGIFHNFFRRKEIFGRSLVYQLFNNPSWYFDGSLLENYVL